MGSARHEVTTMSRRGFLLGAAAVALSGCLPDPTPSFGWGAWCNPEPGTNADEIPAPILAAYRDVAEEYGIPWTLLAGVGWIESRHTPDVRGPALDGGPGIRAIPATPYGVSLHGDGQWERAVGMMQFLPSTFAIYRDRGIVSDPYNPRDSVTAAAAYLVDGGAPGDMRGALLRYNNSAQYVQDVLDAAARYDADGATPVDCALPQNIDLTGVTGSAATIAGLAASGRIVLDDRNRRDIVHPSMDPRVLAIMEAIAAQHSFAVSVIKEGHYMCIGGGDGPCGPRGVSNHWYYRAVDIYMLDGVNVSTANQDARRLVHWLHDLTGPLRPDEVGGPFTDLTASPGWFSDANHQRHLHIGWNETPREQAA